VLPKNKIDLESDYNLQQDIFNKILNGMKMFAQRIGKDGDKRIPNTVILSSCSFSFSFLLRYALAALF
jgi:hypothetical protein